MACMMPERRRSRRDGRSCDNATTAPRYAGIQPPVAKLRRFFALPVPDFPIAVPTADDTPAVRLTDVRLDRGGRAVLRDIALSVPRGSVTAVLGPSGSGKSTLLAALTGELVPAAGTVEVFGQAGAARERALLEMRKGVGVLLQGNGLLTDLTVAENVALPLRTHTTTAGCGDPPAGRDEAACGRPARRRRPVSARTVRRHGAARRAGPRAGAGSAADDLRRTADRPGPDRQSA